MDIYGMSIFQKGAQPSGKTRKKHVVTIMLSFSFFDEKSCDANFLHIYENYLGIF
jgi:hypothetical protein